MDSEPELPIYEKIIMEIFSNHATLSISAFDRLIDTIYAYAARSRGLKAKFFRALSLRKELLASGSKYSLFELISFCYISDTLVIMPHYLGFVNNILSDCIQSPAYHIKLYDNLTISFSNFEGILNPRRVNMVSLVLFLSNLCKKYSLFKSIDHSMYTLGFENITRTTIPEEEPWETPLDIQISYDIDAFYGPISFDNFHLLNLDLFKLNIKSEQYSTIQNTTEACFLGEKAVTIKSLDNMRIGTVYVGGSPVSVYLVFKNYVKHLNIKIDNLIKKLYRRFEELQDSSYTFITSFRTLKMSEKSIQLTANREVISELLDLFRDSYGSTAFIFMESYGMKFKMSSSTQIELFYNISSVFNAGIWKQLVLDVSVNIHVKQKHFVYIHENFYSLMNCVPNYNLFFSTSILNCNEKKLTLSKEKAVFAHAGFWRKVNFYSTIEDTIVEIRKNLFVPNASCGLITNNFLGHKVFSYHKRLANKEFGKLSSMVENLTERNGFPYRLELSVPLINLIDSITLVSNKLKPYMICTLPTNVIVPILRDNIRNFMTAIKRTDTIYSTFVAITMEMIMRQRYLKGSTNLHYIPSCVLEQISSNYIHREPSIITSFGSLLLENVPEVEQIDTITKSLECYKNSKIKENELKLLNQMLEVIRSENYLSALFNLYMDECNEKFKTKIKYLSLDQIQDHEPHSETPIVSYMATYFLSLKKNQPFFFSCAATAIISKYHLSHDQFLGRFIELFDSKKCEILFNIPSLKSRNTARSEKFIMIKKYDIEQVKAVHIRHLDVSETLDPLRIFKDYIYNPSYNAETNTRTQGRRAWNDAERVRLLYAVALAKTSYSKAPKVIYGSCMFAFFFTRTITDLLNFLKRVVKYPNVLFSLLPQIYNWSYTDFGIAQKLEYIYSLVDSRLSDSDLKMFSKIVEREEKEFTKLNRLELTMRLFETFKIDVSNFEHKHKVPEEVIDVFTRKDTEQQPTDAQFKPIKTKKTDKIDSEVLVDRTSSLETRSYDIDDVYNTKNQTLPEIDESIVMASILNESDESLDKDTQFKPVDNTTNTDKCDNNVFVDTLSTLDIKSYDIVYDYPEYVFNAKSQALPVIDDSNVMATMTKNHDETAKDIKVVSLNSTQKKSKNKAALVKTKNNIYGKKHNKQKDTTATKATSSANSTGVTDMLKDKKSDLIAKLRLKYDLNTFTASQSYKTLFSSKYKPVYADWKIFLRELAGEGLVSIKPLDHCGRDTMKISFKNEPK